jgi:predicted phosphoribosyltransferase
MVTLTRSEAGRRLAAGLGTLVKDVPVVVAISPGGAQVASEIARAFDAPLDVLAVCRLEVPGRLHSTFGAVADGAAIVVSRRVLELGLPQAYVAGLVDCARREVERIAAGWRGSLPPLAFSGRTVILADDGASDTLELAAAAQALRQAGSERLILAAPTASADLKVAARDCCDHHLLLFEPGGSDAAAVRDPDFVQATGIDVRAMVRGSRSNLSEFVKG